MPDAKPIQIKPFDALTLRELHACLKLRGEVFVVGQRICAVPDVDELDPVCQHVMLRLDDALVGTARLLPIAEEHAIKVGRVAIAAAHQRRGLGTALMRHLQDWIDEQPGRAGVMHAQAYLQAWYTALGWRRVGEVFAEAGIEHVKMVYGDADAPPSVAN